MTSAPTSTAIPGAPTIGRRTTTRRDLVRLRAVLLVLTAAVLAGSLAAFTGVQSTVRDARVNTAPAVLEVLAARSAIVQADAAAMTSFYRGQAQLSGPGDEYQSQLALATQSLTQVAQHNTDANSSPTLQLVEGLLVTYSGAIERADASFRQNARNPLGLTDLWDGSQQLYPPPPPPGPGSPPDPSAQPAAIILVQLDTLTGQEQGTLASQLSTGWMSPWTQLLWIVPIAALVGVLLLAQRYLARRFRRTVNLALLAATVLLLLVAAATSTVFVSQAKAATALDTLNRVSGQRQEQVGVFAAAGQRALGDVFYAQCAAPGQDGCGDAVNTFLFALLPAVTGTPPSPPEREPTETTQVTAELAAAEPPVPLGYLIPLGAVAVAVLILVGFQDRLDEYRYQST